MSFNTHENHNITYWTHEEEQAEAAEAFYSDRRRSVNGSHAGGHRSKFRPNEKTASALGQSLTKSNRTSHSAYEICGSDTSVGPDFLHIDEGQFCDMKTKTLWPVCTAEVSFFSSSISSFFGERGADSKLRHTRTKRIVLTRRYMICGFTKVWERERCRITLWRKTTVASNCGFEGAFILVDFRC